MTTQLVPSDTNVAHVPMVALVAMIVVPAPPPAMTTLDALENIPIVVIV
jgi:hypothetical protein